jgi:hypothetical protein
MAAATPLDRPVAARGEARTAFFNGRLLSAEDLQREQALRDDGQRRLARLVGCGIERGLRVNGSAGSTQLDIGDGLGLTPSGTLIETDGFTLDLAATAGTRVGRFGDCQASFLAGEALEGLHLLVLTPDWVADGRAPTLLGEVGACNRRVEYPAVRTRLVALRPPADVAGPALRNRLAAALLSPPAGTPGRTDRLLGWWSTVLAPTLRADDLPIAVLQLDSAARVLWVDAEAARRRLAPAPGGSGDALWPASRQIEIEAFVHQMTAQLTEPRRPVTSPGPAAAYAILPPVLLLDTAGLMRWRETFGAFGSLVPPWSRVLGHARFTARLTQALAAEPVALATAVARLYQRIGAAQYLLRLHAPGDPDLADEGTGEPQDPFQP